MKPLDMADKYPPAESFEDDEPTIKMLRPTPHEEETSYPGVGLLLTFGVSLVFWGTLAYFVFWR